jgi:predicted ATP-grasp superfamily ATP-dependent carboligase
MKKILMISLVSIALTSFSAHAQEVSKDSINILKQEKENLEISKRLNDNKLKLAKLENTVKEKNENVSSSASDAQQAASDNQETAQKLNDNSQDKKLAKRARRDAKHAQKSAKAGRSAVNDLEDLQSDIKSLKKKIAEDEAKLGIAPAIAAQQ